VAEDVTLLIKLQDQASPKLKRLTQSTKRLEQAANGAQNSIRRTNKGIRDTGRVADRASKGVNKLGKAVRGLIAGFTAVQAFKFVIFKTAELERQTKSLQVLTGSLGNARNIIAELQQFGAVTPFTSAELIETAKRLKAFGFETEQVVDVTKRLADVAGATGADLGGIATAFGQIQAKGRLQGEELLQLQERGVGLQDELQKMYGLTADEFRKALEGGRISADAVNLALQNITDTGGKYANGAIAQSETLAGKFSTLTDNVERLAQKIGEMLAPSLRDALTVANNLVTSINQGIAAQSISTKDKARFQREAEQEVRRFGGGFGVGNVTVRHLGKTYSGPPDQVIRQISNDLVNREVRRRAGESTAAQATATAATAVTPPALLAGRTGTGDTGMTDAERITQQLERQVVALKEAKLLAAGKTSEDKAQIQLGIDIANLEKLRTAENSDLVDLVIQGTKGLYDQEVATAANIKADKERADAKAKADAAEKKRLEQIRGIYQGISDTIADGVVNSLKAAIDGTKSFAEVVTGVFTDLQNQLLQLIRNQIFFGNLTGTLTKGSGLFGSLFAGFLANGGPAQAGRAYMVGERGPEMFIPRSSGTVIPNNQLGGGGANVVVNVDASGSSVQGDEGQSRQLGALIGAAVQTEIIKQQRPGGLLSR